VVKGLVVTGSLRQKPTDNPPPLEVYAKRPIISQVALSPDGSQVALVADYDGTRVLVAHRFADKSKRMVRLLGGGGGEVASIAWADEDTIMLAASKSTLRGTCNVGDQQAIQVNIQVQTEAMNMASDMFNSGTPQDALNGASNMASSDQLSALQALGGRWHSHPCVYYGVREQDAITSVDMAKKAGHTMGLRFGDYVNRPLGIPDRVEFKGKPQLAGPFLEVRAKPIGDEPAERVYLWRVDSKSTVGQLVNDGGGDIGREDFYVDDWLMTRQGDLVARSLYDYAKARFVIQMRQQGKWKSVLARPIDPKGHTFAPYLVGLGQHDGSVVILDAKSDGTAGGRSFHYFELGPDGAISGPLEPSDAARDRPVVEPRTGKLAGFAEDGASETYTLFNPDLQDIYQRALDALPGENVRIVSTSDDPRKVVIYAQGREDPGAYYFLDFSEGSSVNVGDDYPLIPTDWVASQTQITYKASDGLEINAILTMPPKAAKAKDLPLVVLPHDGLQAHDRQDFNWLAQALASRGYLVLQPNVRGSDGFGPAFLQAGYGELGRKMQTDLVDGVRALAAEGLSDPKRVCVLGIGFGGYAALAAASDASTYRCAGAINAVSDPDSYYAWEKRRQLSPDQDQITTLVADHTHSRAFQVNPGSPQVLAAYIGAAGSAPSPEKQAASVAVPVLLLVQNSDEAVPASQSHAMHNALKSGGKDVELVEVKGASDHTLQSPEARLATLNAVIDFLAKRNPAG
jgi:dipeptidyl aminopeptidase/acylaminoacyl peptidase